MKDFIIPDRDFGTPAAKSKTMVTLTIDGFDVTVPEGTSIMRAAAEIGIQVPKLCATDSVDAFGSCRLCLVEIEGRNGTPASCTTPVAPGIKVHTQTAKLKQLRRGVMELYISDHPLDCLTCSANGDCELQDMAGAVGLRDVRYDAVDTHFQVKNTSGEANPLWHAEGRSNPYFTYDPQKCIVCSRCVRACEEVQGTFALTIEGRGFDSRVSFGARTDDALAVGLRVLRCLRAGLPDRDPAGKVDHRDRHAVACHHHHLRLLRRGMCSFKAEMRGDELVRMVPYKHGKANRGHSCVKGRFAYGYATHQDRILKPMIRDSDQRARGRKCPGPRRWNSRPTKMKGIQAQYGRNSVGVITSSRCTNEETYLVQKLTRAVFMNNNTDTCARVCHSPTGYGLGQTFGTSAGTQDFDSVEESDVILVIGANPSAAHPVFASRMKKRLRKGAKLIVVDPRRTETVEGPHYKAAHHLALTPGTNVAVVSALAHVIVTEKLYDEDFIRTRCDWDEFQDYAEFISAPNHSPEAVELVTGVPAEEVRKAARLYATGGNAAIYYGLGVTEHSAKARPPSSASPTLPC
jgi:formate dehydrogenase major subunit